MSVQRIPQSCLRAKPAILAAIIAFLCQVSPSLRAEHALIRIDAAGQIKKQIDQLNGRILRTYASLDLVLVDLSPQAAAVLRARLGNKLMFEDSAVSNPGADALPRMSAPSSSQNVVSLEPATSSTLFSQTMGGAVLNGTACDLNNPELHVNALHANGFTGAGVTVATIDTGIRPGYPTLESDNSVIGGEDLAGDGLGYINLANNGHGTAVAALISGNAMLPFNSSDPVVTAVSRYCPDAVLDSNPNDSLVQIPLVGSAPSANIYAVRVFPPQGGSTLSVVLAGMDRVIQLKKNFDAGQPVTRNPDGSYTALNIRVCNMSFGVPPLYPGHELYDQMADQMAQNGILPVAAAGNAGPSGSTVGTPGTSHNALTIGGSSDSTHERIYWDLVYGDGTGAQLRPTTGYQTAPFSSRGPDVDGRADPDVVANGFACVAQGFGSASGIDFLLGTSFATASVSGLAADLAQAVPSATAFQIRNAIMLSANPALLTDRSGPFDQGRGQANAEGALTLLKSGSAPNTPGPSGIENPSVAANLAGMGTAIFQGDVTRTVSSLLPGERFETYYRVSSNTVMVTLTLSNFRPSGTPNAVLGDQIYLAVHDTSYGIDYKLKTYTTGGTFQITDLGEGFLRITVCGRWTNGGDVGVTLQLRSVTGTLPALSLSGQLANQQTIPVLFQLPLGVGSLTARLDWGRNFTSYPADNADLVLIDPMGVLYQQGVSGRNPERVQITAPKPGVWTVNVIGTDIHNGFDSYSLRLYADGLLIK